MESWIIPGERYYYGWYAGADRQDLPHNRPDGAIKADIVERLRRNPRTTGCHLRVDVKQAVVILQGDVPTASPSAPPATTAGTRSASPTSATSCRSPVSWRRPAPPRAAT